MTYEFKVNPDDVDLAAQMLWEIADGNAKAVTYAKEHLNLEGNAGLVLKPLVDILQEACGELEKNYSRLGSITDKASAELKKAATMYRTTDRRWAETLDRSYEAEK